MQGFELKGMMASGPDLEKWRNNFSSDVCLYIGGENNVQKMAHCIAARRKQLPVTPQPPGWVSGKGFPVGEIIVG